MTNLNIEEARNINGGWDRCRICGKTVSGGWLKKYYHCLVHATRCLPWGTIMSIAFGL